MSLSRCPPPLHSTPASSSPPCTSACLLVVIREGSGGLQEWWVMVVVAFCWNSLALLRASSIVLSSSARWHWASSWLDDGEALARRGEEDRDDREIGMEGRGMDMGELMLSLLGGEDEGLILSEEPRRERRLLPLSLSSTLSLETLIQEIFSGMLRCRRGVAERCGTKRGGGGRGGGDRDTLSAPLCFWLLLFRLLSSCSAVFFCRLLWLDWWPSQTSGLSSQECWVYFLLASGLLLLLAGSSLRPSFAVLEGFKLVLWSPSGWWTFMKRGLMKQSAPLDWQHSSSDGVRVRSRGRPGVVATETGLWAGGGGLSGAAVPDNEAEPFLLRHNWVSQKPVWEWENYCTCVIWAWCDTTHKCQIWHHYWGQTIIGATVHKFVINCTV